MTFSIPVPLILGNWKMYKTIEEALAFGEALLSDIGPVPPQVGLAAPFTAIAPLAEKARESSLWIGAQNMNDVEEGAFTGEIAARMLIEAGARFVLLGHSERRLYFSETSGFISKKVKKALDSHLIPILCVGETKADREHDRYEEVIISQLKESLAGVSDPGKLCIAYEPVWAIGSHISATPKEAEEMHKVIRATLESLFQNEGKKIPILYGGSVHPENAAQFLQSDEIQGLLVGGASLNKDQFAAIVAAGVK